MEHKWVYGYQAAGSTCGISPSRSLLDSHTAAGGASHIQTQHRPAETIRDTDEFRGREERDFVSDVLMVGRFEN